MNDIASNLRTLMAAEDLSENRLSTLTGVPQPTIHRILNGVTADPRDSTVRPLAEYFGVSVEQLRTLLPVRVQEGGLHAYKVKAADGADGIDPAREVTVKEVDVLVSAGHGALLPEFVPTQYRMTYQLSWFQRIGAKPEDIVVMKVHGESMERTLFHGDRVAVNVADNQRIIDGRVYVFAVGGIDLDVKIKRLYKTTDGRLRVVSDNVDKQQYPDEYLDSTSTENFRLVGRVVDRSGGGGL